MGSDIKIYHGWVSVQFTNLHNTKSYLPDFYLELEDRDFTFQI